MQHRPKARAPLVLYLGAVGVLLAAFVTLARSGAAHTAWGLATLAAIELLAITVALRWYTHELSSDG
jgi:uncharacterized membrane protein HdeD (DUF308 family)